MNLPGQSVEAWWRRYARAHILRPYERGWALRLGFARMRASGRLLSYLCFALAHRLDAKGDAFTQRYPRGARIFDRLGVWLVRRGR